MKTLKCYLRESHIKAWKYRKQGYIPAVVYGKIIDKPISIYGEEYAFVEALWSGGIGTRSRLDIEGVIYDAIIKDITLTEETNKLTHMDFQVLALVED